MSDKKYTELPTNRNDLEYDRFGLDADGKVGVRMVDGLKDSSGQIIDLFLSKQFEIMIEQLDSLNEKVEALLNHVRIINELDDHKGNKY